MEKSNSSSQDIQVKDFLFSKLTNSEQVSSLDIAKCLNVDHQKVIGASKSLEMAEVIQIELKDKKVVVLTPEGNEILTKGSPENILLEFLSKNNNEFLKKNLANALGIETANKGFANAMKLKCIKYDKNTDLVSVIEGKYDYKIDQILDDLKALTQPDLDLELIDKTKLNNYKKSKILNVDTLKFFLISKGLKFGEKDKKQETDLTTNLLLNEEYQKCSFKKYNYKTLGKEESNGALHHLLKVRAQFREILLELGFQEMPTNNFIESSFWNFDALFQPQQHPARDAHDTFFLTNPKYSKVKSSYPDYFARVKEMHEIGGHGSIGWKYNWSEEEASKNILRTHTTAVSARMLYKLAKDFESTGKFTPKKYFSIDRVFRNEALDHTHLCEFHQIEGLVADYNLGLGHLIGTIENFFHRFGIKKLRFKPAYNPYTEPSMEIFGYHEVNKKWMEIGNSGIFRPEMLLPMGLPKDVNVIAWGLSLERPAMIHYGFKSIKELFGYEVQIKDTKNSSIYCINLS